MIKNSLMFLIVTYYLDILNDLTLAAQNQHKNQLWQLLLSNLGAGREHFFQPTPKIPLRPEFVPESLTEVKIM